MRPESSSSARSGSILCPAEGAPDKLRLLAACSFFAGDNERAFSAATALEDVAAAFSRSSLLVDSSQRTARGPIPCAIPATGIGLAKSHVLLGDIYHQLEREDDAQAEYQKALSSRTRQSGGHARVGLGIPEQQQH
jgi:hypothetical protein